MDGADGRQTKTLVDEGAGRRLLQLLRFAPGSRARGDDALIQAALIVEGSAVLENETLGVWDFVYASSSVARGSISFPDGAILLAITMR